MLSRAEIKELASNEKNGFYVSLYLNVDPLLNKKGDYMVHFKNMMKGKIESLDKAVFKKVKADLEKIDAFVLGNKRLFKRGLALISSSENSLWKEYHLGVPVKNELIVDRTPFTNPLLDILDNYQKYAVLLLNKESARIFIVHLGDIVEYGEVHTPDVPGKQKKGGWFALSQNHYERHTEFHVGLHLKDVIEKLDSFLGKEYIGKLIIGGSDEAVTTVKGMLRKTVLDRVIGTVKIEMFAKPDEVQKKIEPIVYEDEQRKKEETVKILIAKAMKNENAVVGVDNVLNALQEQRVMRLLVLKDFKTVGYACAACGYLTSQKVDACPYCKGKVESSESIIETAVEKAVQQGSVVEVVAENGELMNAGGIGAFLRF